MVEFDLSKITGREPPTDDGLPCACEWNAAGEPVGLCAAHQSKLDDELAALRERVAELEGKVTAIVGWLEREQPDVFRRGLWDALREVPSAGTGL